MKASEDMDPIETVIDWLQFLVDNDKVSVHDTAYLTTEVIPKAKAQYEALMAKKTLACRMLETED